MTSGYRAVLAGVSPKRSADPMGTTRMAGVTSPGGRSAMEVDGAGRCAGIASATTHGTDAWPAGSARPSAAPMLCWAPQGRISDRASNSLASPVSVTESTR